jgi:4-diphosphocytidyl-2C-methyl-D-erythritol kinase
LEAPVFRRFPEVEQLKKAVASAGFEPVLMSGSGPSVWAAVPKKSERRSVSEKTRGHRALIRNLLNKTGIIPTPRFFIVRPLATCATVSIGGRPA